MHILIRQVHNNQRHSLNLTFKTEKHWLTWKMEYEKYILDFAKLADSTQVEIFCLGTELGLSVEKRPQFWQELIAKTRKVYTGKI